MIVGVGSDTLFFFGVRLGTGAFDCFGVLCVVWERVTRRGNGETDSSLSEAAPLVSPELSSPKYKNISG